MVVLLFSFLVSAFLCRVPESNSANDRELAHRSIFSDSDSFSAFKCSRALSHVYFAGFRRQSNLLDDCETAFRVPLQITSKQRPSVCMHQLLGSKRIASHSRHAENKRESACAIERSLISASVSVYPSTSASAFQLLFVYLRLCWQTSDNVFVDDTLKNTLKSYIIMLFGS